MMSSSGSMEPAGESASNTGLLRQDHPCAGPRPGVTVAADQALFLAASHPVLRLDAGANIHVLARAAHTP